MRWTFKYTEDIPHFSIMLEHDNYRKGDILDNGKGRFIVIRNSDKENIYTVEQYSENYNEIAYNHWKFLLKYNIL